MAAIIHKVPLWPLHILAHHSRLFIHHHLWIGQLAKSSNLLHTSAIYVGKITSYDYDYYHYYYYYFYEGKNSHVELMNEFPRCEKAG